MVPNYVALSTIHADWPRRPFQPAGLFLHGIFYRNVRDIIAHQFCDGLTIWSEAVAPPANVLS